ncbi:DUF4270 family protein [Flavobacterium sp. NST-5]|uniref:DUF4270 family protein n=1 Tax=Flavobacterium ichthyis TaxID=2698827 RepID=A0ABW9ZDW3_9FLAO|nr:DUF4270 family protein [Flavobacterium ichthyis]
MIKNAIGKLFTILGITTLIVSCDKDFNAIGTDIVGDEHFGTERDISSTITIFNQKTGGVETTNLPINPLGIYDSPVFGKTTANFVTQLELQTFNPTFREVTLARIKSVILYVPYFSTVKSSSEGTTIYELDSIFGNQTTKMRLNVYENGYYMRDFDPNTNFAAQKFYSNQDALFNNAKIGSRLNDASDAKENEEFIFDKTEITIPGETEEDDDAKLAPGMRLNLNKQFFFNKIFANSGSNLANNNVFKNYFRGLYFRMEETSGAGALKMLDFTKGTITITYEDKKVTVVDGVETDAGTEEKTLILKFGGKSASLLNQTSNGTSSAYETIVGNIGTGDQKVYIKGGDGSIGLIDLFGGGNSGELEAIRQVANQENWLINEANLVFYVDQTATANLAEPNRLYLYDARNNRPLIDYTFDTSTLAGNSKFNKFVYGGIGEKSTNAENSKIARYKFRITEHIKNVLFKDSTNVRLGLSVTENVNNIAGAALASPSPNFKGVPTFSVINPLGTVVFGNVPVSSQEDKKLQLEIYYTKPN